MKQTKLIFIPLLLVILLITACGKQDEADAERLNEIEQEVLTLFNEEETDLAKGLTEEKLIEVQEAIKEEKDTDFNEENAEKMLSIQEKYELVVNMFDLDGEIQQLFDDEVLQETVKKRDIIAAEDKLASFEEASVDLFVERQSELLSEASEQFDIIEEARSLLDELFTDDKINDGVTREAEASAKDLVARVKNQAIKESLETRLAKVDAYLEDREEAARQKELEEKKQREVEEKRKEEERKKAAANIGNFAGYYLAEDGLLCEVTASRFDCFMPFSDVIMYSKIDKIIENTGTEITVIVEGQELTWQLLNGGNTLQTNETLQRISKEEFDHRSTTLDW